MKNYDELTNDLLERRNQYVTEQRNRKKVMKRVITPICCFCLVALLGIGLWQGDFFKSNPPISDNPGISAGQDDAAGKGTNDEGLSNGEFTGALPNITGVADGDSSDADRDNVKVISSFESQNGLAKYKAPANGDVILTYPLKEAMKEYGDSVVYDVRIYLYKDETIAVFDNNPIKSEAERLSKSGCSVSIELCEGSESAYQFYFTVKAKKSQLDDFAASEDYGYFIRLADENRN